MKKSAASSIPFLKFQQNMGEGVCVRACSRYNYFKPSSINLRLACACFLRPVPYPFVFSCNCAGAWDLSSPMTTLPTPMWIHQPKQLIFFADDLIISFSSSWKTSVASKEVHSHCPPPSPTPHWYQMCVPFLLSHRPSPFQISRPYAKYIWIWNIYLRTHTSPCIKFKKS